MPNSSLLLCSCAICSLIVAPRGCGVCACVVLRDLGKPFVSECPRDSFCWRGRRGEGRRGDRPSPLLSALSRLRWVRPPTEQDHTIHLSTQPSRQSSQTASSAGGLSSVPKHTHRQKTEDHPSAASMAATFIPWKHRVSAHAAELPVALTLLDLVLTGSRNTGRLAGCYADTSSRDRASSGAHQLLSRV